MHVDFLCRSNLGVQDILRIQSFLEYDVILFVASEQNLFTYSIYDLKNETCSLCLHSPAKTEANIWENSRADQ